MLKQNMNIANFLSVLRIISSYPLILCFNKMSTDPSYKFYSILVIIFIVLSDILDGFFARNLESVTNLGKILDPVADKIVFMAALLYLINIYQIPFLIFFILLSIRDIILIIFSLYFIVYRDYVPQANVLGKIFIFSCVLMIVFHIYNFNSSIAQLFYIISILLLVVSTFTYILEHVKKLKA